MNSVASMTLWYEVLCPKPALHSQMGKQFKHTHAHTPKSTLTRTHTQCVYTNTRTFKQPAQPFCLRKQNLNYDIKS